MEQTPAEKAVAKVDRMYARLASRRTDVDTVVDYYRGKQALKFATAEWAKVHRGRYAGFADNWCAVVANSPAERLRRNGFRLPGSTGTLTAAEKMLERAWAANEMDAQSSQGLLQSLIAKRSSVIVWGDRDGRPVMTWESPAQVIVEYDAATGRIPMFALKAWIDDDREYATLYTPTELWKFERTRDTSTDGATSEFVEGFSSTDSRHLSVTAAGGWTARNVDDVWPLRNPLGEVPVEEFQNRPMLGGEPLSEITGSMAMQNAVNLLWAYLFVAADFASMPARVVLGQEPPKMPILDDQGNVVGERPVDVEQLSNGRMMYLTGQNTKIGQWDAARLDVFTGVVTTAVQHLAAQTRTPLHYVSGEMNNINGETVLALETGLVKKVQEMQLFFGPSIRRMNRLVALVENKPKIAESCRSGEVLWADAQIRTGAQAADAALKHRDIGMPLAWIMDKDLGLSATEIETVLAMKRAEAEDPALERVLRELAPPGGQGDA